MNIQFATCDKRMALDFIRKSNAKLSEVKENDINKLLDLVGKDILRIQDPMMYSKAEVVAGNNHSEEYSDQINEAIEQLKLCL